MNDLVRRRIELKYLLPAAKTRDLRAVLTADPESGFRRIGGWVTTVYFDLPDRSLARAAMMRPEENLKLRLREYFDDEGAPCSRFVWIEIKERLGSSSRKSRFRLHKRLIVPFFRGEADLTSILTCQTSAADPSNVCETVQRIHELAGESWMPFGAVRYRRCSIEGGMPAGRLTLDDRISYHLGPIALDGALDRPALGPAAGEEPSGVLEVKHGGDPAPDWCGRLVGRREPAEYSKFLMLARLSFAEASAGEESPVQRAAGDSGLGTSDSGLWTPPTIGRRYVD